MASHVNLTRPHSVIDPILPLEPGDRVTRAEFERRYEAMPQIRKAELVEGVVYMPAAVRFRRHGEPHAQLVTWLGTYKSSTPGVLLADNTSLRLDLDNEPQPDAALFIAPELGGGARISDDDYLEGVPELLVEVASSTASYDLGDKLQAYRRNGVPEYLVWRVLDRAVDWFVLRDGDYQMLSKSELDVYRSELFPGLWLDTDALLEGDLAAVLETQREGLASQAHAEFLLTLRPPNS